MRLLVPLACALLGVTLSGATSAQAPAKPGAPAAKSQRPAARPAARAPVAAPEPAVAAAGGEQIAAAALAHFGEYACEFGEVVHVELNKKHDGYIDVRHRQSTWMMKPVLSSTGALRLEDVRGRILMLQIANKSMLMDTRIGQRLVDNCVHEKQREAATRPPGQSLGIEPARGASAPS